MLSSVVVSEAQGTVCPVVVLVTVHDTAPAGFAPAAEVVVTDAPSALTTAGATLASSFTPDDHDTSFVEADMAIVESVKTAFSTCPPACWEEGEEGVDDASESVTTRPTAKPARSTSEPRRRARRVLV